MLGSTALSFPTWDDALTFLGEQARREPLTLILDEFQWLKAAQPALDSIIQRHWDRWDRNGVPLMLVLSGSALTLMENLLERGAPLFGRATARPQLAPLDFREAAPFARSRDPEALLRRWAVLGGTPQYQLWAGPGELRKVIAERILAKDAPLYDDPRHLLREGEGVRDPGTYLAILGAIARGATRHNEIAQQAHVPTGNLARKIERLEDLGYVTARYPLAAEGHEERTSYQISDPYFRFWFRYVANNRSRLERGRVHEVLDEILGDLDNVMGWAFEECCRRWVGAYADEAEGEPGSTRDLRARGLQRGVAGPGGGGRGAAGHRRRSLRLSAAVSPRSASRRASSSATTRRAVRRAHRLRMRRLQRDDDRPLVPSRAPSCRGVAELERYAGTQFDPPVVRRWSRWRPPRRNRSGSSR